MIISRIKGDTYPIVLEVHRFSDKSLANVTGSAFTLSVSTDREPASSTYLFQVVGSIRDAPNGVVEFPISAGNADSLGRYHFDIQIVSAGEIRTVTKGIISFRQDITK
jgi:hypothetical protein